MKTCSRCGVEKPESEFVARRASRDGLTAACGECLNAQKRADYRSDPLEKEKAIARTKKSWSRMRKESAGFNNSWSAWLNAKRDHRVPAWVRHRDFVPIYEEAVRSGLLVDHIIPLRGKYVSGLHVPSNVQITDPISNTLKSNTHPCSVVVNAKRAAKLRKSEKWDALLQRDGTKTLKSKL